MSEDKQTEATHENSGAGNTRKLIQGSLATTGVLIALGIAIAVNLIASQLFWRVDMTENKIYTLSEPSQQFVAELEEPVTVKVFLSPDMPAPFHTLQQRISDLLIEYEAASRGNLTFEVRVVEDSDEEDEEAKNYGCEKVAIGQETRNEVNIRAVYKCVAFVQGTEQQVLRDVRLTGNIQRDNLEYHFTKALLNLGVERSRKIAFLSGFGGPSDSPNFIETLKGPFRALYGDLIEPVEVSFEEGSLEVPADVSALILLDLERPVSPRAKFAIDQFLQRGGSVGWYQSATSRDHSMLDSLAQSEQFKGRALPDMRKTSEHGLTEFFGAYGVLLQSDLLVDPTGAMTIQAMTAQGPSPVSFPPVFQVNDIDRSLPFLAGTPPIVFPAPSSIVLTEALRKNDRIKVTEALVTSPEASRHFNFPTQRSFETYRKFGEGQEKGTHLIGVTLEGEFPSYYANAPLPEGVTEAQLYQGEKRPGRLFVIGSGDFYDLVPTIGFNDQLAGIGQQLLFSSFEWLAQDNALSRIREKRLPRYIGEINSETQRSIQFINILFVPACFALIGSIMMFRRRKRRERLAAHKV